MNRRLLRGAVTACGVLISSLAGAAEEEPEEFDWPVEFLLLTDVPQVQEPGTVQAQTALFLRSTPEGSEFEVALEGEVGLGDRLQLEAEVEWSRERAGTELSRGVSEVGVGVRRGLLESAASGFSLSLGLEGELARPEFSDDRWAVHAPLLAFQRVGSLGLNAVLRPGLAYTRQGRFEPRAEFGLGVLWGSGSLVPLAEVHAELGDERAFEAVGGLKIKLGPIVEIGVGGLIGRLEDDGIYGATTSILLDLEG